MGHNGYWDKLLFNTHFLLEHFIHIGTLGRTVLGSFLEMRIFKTVKSQANVNPTNKGHGPPVCQARTGNGLQWQVPHRPPHGQEVPWTLTPVPGA